MTTESKLFEGDTSVFVQYERDGFRNLRDRDGKIQPLFRVMTKDEAEKGNQDPFKAHSERLEKRRIPQAASPIVDFLVELDRTLHYPQFPSRHHSRFANLGGHQPLRKDGLREALLVLPHESARISLSGVQDFKVEDPEALCKHVQEKLRNRLLRRGRSQQIVFDISRFPC